MKVPNLRECDPPKPVDPRSSKLYDETAHETPSMHTGENKLSGYQVKKPDTSNPGGKGMC